MGANEVQGPARTPENPENDSSIAVKRKLRFPIGEYARQRKMARVQAAKEMADTDKVVDNLRKKLSYRKQKVDQLESGLEKNPITDSRASRRPNISSSIDPENSHRLKMGMAQQTRRKGKTMSALKEIHCNTMSNDLESKAAVKDGLWTTLITEVSSKELKNYMVHSKTCMQSVVPGIIKDAVKAYEKTDANYIRSASILYKGGLLSKRKYQNVRNNDKESSIFEAKHCIPRVCPYNKLISYINRLDVGVTTALPQQVQGVFRNTEGYILRLAEMYLSVLGDNITWFNGEVGRFYIAIGADAAPFGKDESATAFLVSFLNILDGVASCSNNYLLMGANCSETHPVMYSYVRDVVTELEAIESKDYKICGKQITFKCKLVPADQKWHAAMGGELSNAATYFSTYGNVSTANSKTMGGSLGDSKKSTWKLWKYQDRLKTADEVDKFKQKNKIPDNCSKSERTKVTKFIASKKSRQEFKPPLGKYIDLCLPDPLHNANNAWQKWHFELLLVAMKFVSPELLKKADNVSKLPNDNPFVIYLNCLDTKVKCGRLVKNLERWYNEKRPKGEEFSYHFTGKESRLFCWHYMEVISVHFML
ncbi:hypothetical protein AC249_AIPGENE18417 [Exaiptasia diaphana]|nr:hypothetical protein AC249_AIPGENE18417 [Exaiptasia diaphana]